MFLILKSEELSKKLFFMERFINSNVYQPKQALYRGMKNLFDEGLLISNSISIGIKLKRNY